MFGYRVAALVCAAVGLGLRVPCLEGVPNPAHDEGNWLLLGHRLFTGQPASLAGDQGFVTTLYAHAIALAWRVTGAGVAGARAVQVVAVVLGSLGAYALCERRGAPRAGVVLTALLAVHPWSVAWSRVAVAPYALSLTLAVLATLAVARAWEAPRGSLPARIAAGQLLALGFHFSPLAAIPALAAGIWISLRHRRFYADRATLMAGLLALLHVAPVVRAALRVSVAGATRPSAPFAHLRGRLANYAMTLLEGLSGEATARDFAGVELRGPGAVVLVAATLALVGWCLRPPADPAHRSVHGLARIGFVLAVPGIALLLAPMRQWHLPSVDAERYVFALLAPTLVLLALAAERARGRWLPALGVAWLGLSPTARTARALLTGGSPDHGVLRAEGGGAQRRWRPCATRVPVAEEVLRAADALGRGRGVVVVVPDYVFHPVHFFNRHRPHTVIDASYAPVPRRPGSPVLFATWAEGLLRPGHTPASDLAARARLADLLRGPRFTGLRPWGTLAQPDGRPLVTLWAAVDGPFTENIPCQDSTAGPPGDRSGGCQLAGDTHLHRRIEAHPRN